MKFTLSSFIGFFISFAVLGLGSADTVGAIAFSDNLPSFLKIPFLDFTNLALISKIFIFIWTIFISIGIWRAAENYKGSIIWIVLTFIIVAYRCYSLRLIFFI